MYKCDGKVLCQLAGHGPGHSMPALLQPAVVSTVSTLDIYTPQSHRTPGPDNTPQYWAHTDTNKGSKWCCETPRMSDKWSEPHFYNTANKMKIAQTKVSIVRNWKDDNNSYIWCLCAFNVTLIWNRSEDKPVPWLQCDRQDCRWWLQQNICPKYFVKIQFRLGQVPIQSWTWQISAL